jgi:short-subunit dehydrogenase
LLSSSLFFLLLYLAPFGSLAISIAQLIHRRDISELPIFVRSFGSRNMGQRRKLNGLRIVITGASQGIGRALAEVAAKRGARVLAVARSDDLLTELAQKVRASGGIIETVHADITSRADREAMAGAALKHFGGVDVLVNNAGIGATGHFAECSSERLRKIMEVNFFALIETTRQFLPLLRLGTTPAILNISSIAGKRGIPARSEYSASKFAVHGFSEALRAELAKDGIDVLLVGPGLTQTNFSQNMLEQKAALQLDHMRAMSAEAVAEATLRALERGRNEVYLSWSGRLIVLVNRFFPRLADRIARRKVFNLFRAEIESGGPKLSTPTAIKS